MSFDGSAPPHWTTTNHWCGNDSAGARTFPARSFPPDGTTFSQIALGQKLSKQISPYSYWNMQFYQSEPAYVKFDYNIPRGASIGVYARRNALPTHTQYHFKEVLSGFNARTTRSTHVSIYPTHTWAHLAVPDVVHTAHKRIYTYKYIRYILNSFTCHADYVRRVTLFSRIILLYIYPTTEKIIISFNTNSLPCSTSL